VVAKGNLIVTIHPLRTLVVSLSSTPETRRDEQNEEGIREEARLGLSARMARRARSPPAPCSSAVRDDV
jgi:hypothetical protein